MPFDGRLFDSIPFNGVQLKRMHFESMQFEGMLFDCLPTDDDARPIDRRQCIASAAIAHYASRPRDRESMRMDNMQIASNLLDTVQPTHPAAGGNDATTRARHP